MVWQENTDLNPQQCRARADVCRELARKMQDTESRKKLEDMAAAWEGLALVIEGR